MAKDRDYKYSVAQAEQFVAEAEAQPPSAARDRIVKFYQTQVKYAKAREAKAHD